MKTPVLILNPYGRCNCRCVMCDIWKRDAPEAIREAQFEAQMESIGRLGVEWVVFSGGEPLMHAGLFRMCEKLRNLGIRVTVLSSGLLLSRFAAQLVRHVDDVIVSLDGPRSIHNEIRRVASAFELLEAGVRSLRAALSGYPVAGRCTVQRGNCGSLADTVAAARDIGLDSISFLAADVHSEAFNRQSTVDNSIALTLDDMPVVESQIETLIRSGDCGGFVVESAGKLRRISAHFRSHLGMTEPVSPSCNAPWNSAVIEADGAVRPCFFHAPVGSLSTGATLDQIVNGFEATAFRTSLDVARNPVCRRCVCSLNFSQATNFSRTTMGSDHVREASTG